jgi:hypothetical protein
MAATPTAKDQQARLQDMDDRIEDLRRALEDLEGYERIARPLGEGLHEIAEQLRPLRHLTSTSNTRGDKLPSDTVDALENLRASLAQPGWEGAATIPSVDGLPFFGQVQPTDKADRRRDEFGE